MQSVNLQKFDPELYDSLKKEETRQKEKLELIASENYVSSRILEATGSIFTNKYAEGYPAKRYYGGCENVDFVENLAISRLTKLFNSEDANVQPHSGSQANMATFLSLAKTGDTILGMDLAHGGHLTHGASVSFSGFLFRSVFYGIRKDNHLIDYDQVLSIAKQEKPKIIIAGASAYSRFIDFKAFRDIADQVGAYLVTDMAHIAGIVAAGLHPNPAEYSHVTTSTTHKTLRGPRSGIILSSKDLIKGINSKIFPGIQGGPLCHVMLAKAVAFKEAAEPAFKTYIEQVLKNAKALAKALIDKDYTIITGGTDNHLFLVDLTPKNITGKIASDALDKANITVNKNAIPFDTQSPFITSGIRLGTAALTTRGFKEDDMFKVADFIDQSLANTNNESKLLDIGNQIKEWASTFSLFKE